VTPSQSAFELIQVIVLPQKNEHVLHKAGLLTHEPSPHEYGVIALTH